MTGKIAMKQITMLTLIAVLPMAVDAALSVSRGTVKNRTAGPACLSGITYAGGTTYYVIADNGTDCGLYKATINLGSDGKSVSSYSLGSKISLAMVSDIEGVAYDPASGNVWVSDESTQTITEFDPSSGAAIRRVDVPAVMKKIVGNYGFESLTISGDGLTMWTANEEALTVDGARSSYSAGTTVRLVRFVRATVHDNWALSAMYAYTTDKWHQPYGYGTAGRRGISDLCALPDGSLLVLERELSTDESGTGLWAGLGVNLYYSFYLVTPSAMASAKDINGAEFDVGLKNASGWTAISKTHLYSNNPSGDREYWSNCEGICLGPRLSSGATELLTLTDAGDGNTDAQFIPFALSGLSVRTLAFSEPAAGRSSIVGSNYRFVDGSAVTLELAGMSSSYVIDGTDRHTCQGWSVSNQTPSSGTGTHATFTVAADGTFAWNVKSETASTGFRIADSFEGYSVGTAADAIDGWSGEECSVVAQSYTPPTPPGHVMAQETHAKVLDATEDEAIRTLPTQMPGDDRFDVMVCVRRSASELKTLPDDIQIQLAFDPQGRLCVWHSYEEGGELKKGWISLSETVYADGEWVRLGIELDYTSNPSGDAFAKVTVNGSCQPTVHGVRSPTDLRAYGPWHYLAKNRRTGGVSLPNEIGFTGTKVDDLMLCKKTVAPEHTGATSVDGIEFSWFDNAGLPRNPLAAAPFIPGYTLGDVYTAGLDPYSDRPLELVDFRVGEHGEVHAEFNGYKGEEPIGYQMLYSTTPDFKSPVVLQPSEGKFDGDATTWTTTWNGRIPDGEMNGGFYRLRAVR